MLTKNNIFKTIFYCSCETAALILKCLDDGAKAAGYEKM